MYGASNGGFGGAPKFPRSHELSFLLRYWVRTGTAQALEMRYTCQMPTTDPAVLAGVLDASTPPSGVGR